MPDIKQTTHDLEQVVIEANPWKESPPVNCSVPYSLLCDVLSLLKEQAKQIDQLEYNLATTEDNLRYYINGND